MTSTAAPVPAAVRDDLGRQLALGLAAILGGAGVLHFARPEPFVAIVPRSLPAPAALVAISGVAELACAGLLAFPSTRKAGGLAAAAVFVGVFPANVSMALRARGRPAWYRALVWARLPVQVPLVVGALRVGVGTPARRRVSRG